MEILVLKDNRLVLRYVLRTVFSRDWTDGHLNIFDVWQETACYVFVSPICPTVLETLNAFGVYFDNLPSFDSWLSKEYSFSLEGALLIVILFEEDFSNEGRISAEIAVSAISIGNSTVNAF